MPSRGLLRSLYKRAQQVRTLIRREFDAAFEKFDVDDAHIATTPSRSARRATIRSHEAGMSHQCPRISPESRNLDSCGFIDGRPVGLRFWRRLSMRDAITAQRTLRQARLHTEDRHYERDVQIRAAIEADLPPILEIYNDASVDHHRILPTILKRWRSGHTGLTISQEHYPGLCCRGSGGALWAGFLVRLPSRGEIAYGGRFHLRGGRSAGKGIAFSYRAHRLRTSERIPRIIAGSIPKAASVRLHEAFASSVPSQTGSATSSEDGWTWYSWS